MGWRPLVDDRSDRKEPVLMIIGTREQIEGVEALFLGSLIKMCYFCPQKEETYGYTGTY